MNSGNKDSGEGKGAAVSHMRRAHRMSIVVWAPGKVRFLFFFSFN
jgi:hypothetical protein